MAWPEEEGQCITTQSAKIYDFCIFNFCKPNLNLIIAHRKWIIIVFSFCFQSIAILHNYMHQLASVKDTKFDTVATLCNDV